MKNRHLKSLDLLPAEVRGGVLTIGNFDGVHVGHREILSTAKSIAASLKPPATVVAMTFDPPPDLVIRPSDVPQTLTPPDIKAKLLIQAGADWIVTARTDKAMLAMTPEQFVGRIIVEKFAPRCMVEGRNFMFGAGRSGTIDTLIGAGKSAGFTVNVADPVMDDFQGGAGALRVSSTLIRRFISQGDIAAANRCLTRPFTLFGQVVHGLGRGKELGFPTVNIDIGPQIRPADGVYAAWASVAGENFESLKKFQAAVSIGSHPTFSGDLPIVEAFLIDARGDYYRQFISLSLIEPLRGQKRFPDAEALKAQIEKDVIRVREIIK